MMSTGRIDLVQNLSQFDPILSQNWFQSLLSGHLLTLRGWIWSQFEQQLHTSGTGPPPRKPFSPISSALPCLLSATLATMATMFTMATMAIGYYGNYCNYGCYGYSGFTGLWLHWLLRQLLSHSFGSSMPCQRAPAATGSSAKLPKLERFGKF